MLISVAKLAEQSASFNVILGDSLLGNFGQICQCGELQTIQGVSALVSREWTFILFYYLYLLITSYLEFWFSLDPCFCVFPRYETFLTVLSVFFSICSFWKSFMFSGLCFSAATLFPFWWFLWPLSTTKELDIVEDIRLDPLVLALLTK